MSTPARIAGHPIHPMFIVFPIGLWVFSLACDIIYRLNGDARWLDAALFAIGGGIIGALIAAVPGFIDLLSLPASRAKSVGIWHMTLNLLVVVIFLVNFFIRMGVAMHGWTALILSIVGVGVLAVSGWLGGSLVYLYGVAVDPRFCAETRSQPLPRPDAPRGPIVGGSPAPGM